jgi:hypothetical protein
MTSRGLIIIYLLLTLNVNAQYVRQKRDVFPMFGDLKRTGWIISPGATYTVGNFNNDNQIFYFYSDSTYNINFNPGGKFGFLVEVGRFYAPKNAGFIKLIDFGLTFKLLRGKELFLAKATGKDLNLNIETTGTSIFNQGFISGAIHFNNLKQVTDRSYILNGIGVNLDYTLIDKVAYDFNGLPLPINHPNTIFAQLNYKIGYGFRARKDIIIMPTLETPILNVWDFENGKSTLSYFNSRYRPLLLKVSFLLIDEKPERKCPGSKGKRKKTSKSKDDKLWTSSRNAPW